MKRVFTCLVVVFALTRAAWADQTTIGVTVNGTTGAHLESYESESLPFLPLPTIELDHTHKRFRLHLEVMPPIGPVPLAQGSSFDDGFSQNPRLSYVSGELRYLFTGDFSLGLGETVLNQQTTYPPTTVVSSSRVVGMRLFAGGTLFRSGNRRLDASLAVSPSMQGLQTGYEPEHASLVDSSLRWTLDQGAYLFSYGVRYVNYTAAYTDQNELADRNHLFMPFVAFDWRLGSHARSSLRRPAAVWEPPPAHLWHAGLTLLGTNGSRSVYASSGVTPLPFVLLPLFSLDRTDARSILAFEAIPPNQSSNLFGSLGELWSYLSGDALLRLGHGRYAIGLGETVVNQQIATPPVYENQYGRSEGLHAVSTVILARSVRTQTTLRVSASPYLHIRTILDFYPPVMIKPIETIQHGARIDTALAQSLQMRGYALRFGLRYINQTTDYGPIDRLSRTSGLELTRSSSLNPFVGVNLPL